MLEGSGYLAGSEGDSVAELHSVLLLPVVQPLPADADCHRAQILIKPEIVLMLWRSSEKDQNSKHKQHIKCLKLPSTSLTRKNRQRCETCYSCLNCVTLVYCSAVYMQYFSKQCCSFSTPRFLTYVNILCGLTLDRL